MDPETHVLFLFARCRPTQARCSAARVGIAVGPAAAAAAAAADTALGNLLIIN